MKELFIGEIIKRKRKELGLTQEQLCKGICEPSTISRIESGRQVPAKNKLDALLQRLGLPGERYSGQLGCILSVLGYAYYAKKGLEDSKRCFYQAYYMYTVMQDEENVKLAVKDLKNFFAVL